MRSIATLLALAPLLTNTLVGQRPDSLTEEVRKYVSLDTAVVALTHATVFDGTGGRCQVGSDDRDPRRSYRSSRPRRRQSRSRTE